MSYQFTYGPLGMEGGGSGKFECAECQVAKCGVQKASVLGSGRRGSGAGPGTGEYPDLIYTVIDEVEIPLDLLMHLHACLLSCLFVCSM